MKKFLCIGTPRVKFQILLFVVSLCSINLFAAEIVAPAMNCISADRAANSAAPAFTTLEAIIIKEDARRDFQPLANSWQTLVLTISPGWQFKPGSGVVRSSGKDLSSVEMSVTARTIQIRIRVRGMISVDQLRLEGIQVQGLDGRKVNEPGTVFRSFENPGTAKIKGLEVNAGTSLPFCTLVQQPGEARQLVFANRPAAAISGELLTEQPVIVCTDQFGNQTREGLNPVEMVKLKISSGSGTLEGVRILNIGTDGGNGKVQFEDLRISGAGEQRMMASCSKLVFAITNEFTVSEEEETTNFFADDPDLVCRL